jgi:hypothetical protein
MLLQLIIPGLARPVVLMEQQDTVARPCRRKETGLQESAAGCLQVYHTLDMVLPIGTSL